MPTFDATTATCHVDAFKEGLLSRVGHNVRMVVERFEVTVEADRIEASFDPSSLKVMCAIKDGVEDHSALSAKDKATIEGYVRKDILEASRFPKVEFVAEEVDLDGDDIEIEGLLQLHGAEEELAVRGERVGEHWVATVKLHQPDWGIRPFKALMGALKIKPGIAVQIRLPAAAFSE